MFIGHFSGSTNSAEIMAGVGVGDMITNISGRSVIVGLNGALETFVA